MHFTGLLSICQGFPIKQITSVACKLRGPVWDAIVLLWAHHLCSFPHSLLWSQWPSCWSCLSALCSAPLPVGSVPLIFLSPARSWFRSQLCKEALPGLSSMHALSRSVVSDWVTPWTRLAPLSMGNSPGKNIAVGCHSLLQGIFPNQGSQTRNLGLLHCRQIVYSLSYQGSLSNLLIPLPCFLFLAFTTTWNKSSF